MLIDTSINLYVFVGEKISVIEYDPNADYDKPLRVEIDSTTGDSIVYRRSYIMDNAFEAKFKILASIFNDLKTDSTDEIASILSRRKLIIESFLGDSEIGGLEIHS